MSAMRERGFSVIMAAYQHGPYIREAIEGVLMQRTDRPIQLLVGEDGSNDGTREICQELAAQHPDRITLLLRDRGDVIHIGGHATGRANVLDMIARAEGAYLAWCPGDDKWLDPEKLERQVVALESDVSCFGGCHASQVIDGQGKVIQELFRERMPERLTLRDCVAMRSPFHMSSFMVRNSGVMRALPPLVRDVASLDMALFTLASNEGDLVCVPGVLSAYRKHGSGITEHSTHLGDGIHRMRVAMWLQLRRHFAPSHADVFDAVIAQHLMSMAASRVDLATIGARVRLMSGHASYFLAHPRQALALLGV